MYSLIDYQHGVHICVYMCTMQSNSPQLHLGLLSQGSGLFIADTHLETMLYILHIYMCHCICINCYWYWCVEVEYYFINFLRYGASIFLDANMQSPVFSYIYHNPQCSFLLYPSQEDPPSLWDQVLCIQIKCWFKTMVYSCIYTVTIRRVLQFIYCMYHVQLSNLTSVYCLSY